MTNFLRFVLLKIIYPLLMLASTVSHGLKERFQLWVININNRLVRMSSLRTKSILLLLPHCLQISDCDVRITHNIYNCKRCGRCGIKDLISIAENNSLNLFVATGGTLARKIVKEKQPEAIIAIACERDLSSGIIDSYPLPVLGITNKRPFGPCFNTQVDPRDVKEAIEFFAG
ncbi:MAG: DUF116 domain-containing protein [Nitrospiraceae bacterium]|nr:DUF116 domain-containing protein [Nitrospiraceae bacterium]